MGILEKHDTLEGISADKDKLEDETKEIAKELADLQRLLVADGSKSLLVILQGMDASGKDGATREVFKYVNPNGIKVHSFKKPTDEELAHDFLWRVHKVCPANGMIQVFNRSHYEDILVPTAEGWIDKDTQKKRMEVINDFEKMLQFNGTTILKFYLHINKGQQEERLLERINIKRKHFKHNDGDWEVRKKWDEYMEVYEEIFKHCDSPKWHIVPAGKNRLKENYIAKEVKKALENMKLEYPALDSDVFTPEYED